MGRKHSEETRAKLRAARLRNIAAGVKNGMSGKRHSEESKAKNAAAHKGRTRGDHAWYIGAKVYHIKQNAARRGIAWMLTDEEAKRLVANSCNYCGSVTQPVTRTKNWSLSGVNGIDRLNSSSSYTLENCVTACSTCNIAKAQMSVSDFYEWIKRVHSRLPK